MTIRKNARPVSTRRGSRGVSSCGSSSPARTIGPATRCGKNAWNTANRISVVGTSSPRYVSTTYEIAMNVKKETPTGSVTFVIHDVPSTLSSELRKKFVYLKYARIPRSNAIAAPSSAFRAATAWAR